MLRPIRTQQLRVSWRAVAAMNLLWVCMVYYMFVTTNALVFTLRHFTADPRVISLVTSAGAGFQMLLGPIFNFVSDRVWTRFGRRRPFVICGWLAAAATAVTLPAMPSLGALISLALLQMLFVEAIASPLEPLWMEVVPPAQRGRGLALRNIMIQGASLFYFQLMFPLFDRRFSLPRWLPIGDGSVTGEQLIYFSASVLFFVTAAMLIIAVRETPVRRMKRTLPASSIGSGVQEFVREVFGDRRWWWIYLLYFCTTPAFTAAWGGMAPLLLTEQFGFSKRVVALSGLPAVVLTICLITPAMGWYSDKMPRFRSILLFAVAALAGAAAWIVAAKVTPSVRQELPRVDALLLIGTLLTVSSCAVFMLATQTLLNVVGSEGRRVWVLLLSLAEQTLAAGAAWFVIKYTCAAAGPTALTWFMFTQFTATFSTAAGVVTSPVVFDFVPRDRLGTLSSGFGLMGGLASLILSNLGGTWIYYLSRHHHGSGANDYATSYVFQFVAGVGYVAVTAYFIRAFRSGKVREYGLMGETIATAPAPA